MLERCVYSLRKRGFLVGHGTPVSIDHEDWYGLRIFW